MDDDLIKAIHEVRSIALENNQILKGIRRRARMATVLHVFYWLLIIGMAAASYYYLEPYMGKFAEAYRNMQTTQQKVSDFSQNLNVDAIKNYLVGTSTSK